MKLDEQNILTHEVSEDAKAFYEEHGGNYAYLDVALRETTHRHDEKFLLDLLVLALQEARSKNTCVRLLSAYRRQRQKREDALVRQVFEIRRPVTVNASFLD